MNAPDLLQQALDALKGVVRLGVDNGRTLNLSVTTDSEVAKRIYAAIAAIKAAKAQPADDLELLRQALDSLEECARLLGATQANKGFGCYTENDARFERLMYEGIAKHRRFAIEAAQAQRSPAVELPIAAQKFWLWRNFVDGRPEYWAFDNPFPINPQDGDPQTLGEPCGYAIFKPSRNGRPDVSEARVLAAIAAAQGAKP